MNLVTLHRPFISICPFDASLIPNPPPSLRQLFALVENQSDWYKGSLWTDHRPWPAVGRGYNTGVILMNLERMREHDWRNKWRMVAEKYLVSYFSTQLADQVSYERVDRSVLRW